MITLAIAAILSSLAAPSFTNMIKDNRMTTQFNELLTSMSLARSEAIKRGLPVTACKSDDQDAAPSCGGNWEDGWIVFVDNNSDGSIDAGEEIIQMTSALSGGNTLNFGRNRVTYRADALAIGFTGTFTLCDDRKNSDRKGLVVSNTGRVRQAIAADALNNCP